MTAGGRLFAVGEAAASHGVYRPGGTALNAGQVGSTRAAQYIAAHCRGDASAGFDAAASAALAEMAALADACRADTGNVRALWQHAAEEMSRCAAAIRDPAQIRAYGKQVEAQLADFAQTVKAGSRTELAMFYRLRDMLLSQRAYLYRPRRQKPRQRPVHRPLRPQALCPAARHLHLHGGRRKPGRSCPGSKLEGRRMHVPIP